MDLATQIIKDLNKEGFAVPDTHNDVVAQVLTIDTIAVVPPVVVAAGATTSPASGTKRGPKKGTVSAFAYFRDQVAIPEWNRIKESDKSADYKSWQAEHLSGRWAQIKANKPEFDRYQGLAKEATAKNQAEMVTIPIGV